jgi:hypothetical protein
MYDRVFNEFAGSQLLFKNGRSHKVITLPVHLPFPRLSRGTGNGIVNGIDGKRFCYEVVDIVFFQNSVNIFRIIGSDQDGFQLGLNLRAIISQRLIPSIEGKRMAAIEILIDTPRVKDLIMKRQIDVLKEAMAAGGRESMQTFDQAIYKLYKSGTISYENAIAYADSANDLRLKIKLDSIEDNSTESNSEDNDSDSLHLKSDNLT